ncbi:LRR receptor-like serine/threonine-protein kinase FLS2 [Ziziphus jujuba]|uniref:LRR receptor-like serine/threonine-protein kinase FLS2 n=1 Tax=Ziziphus jujuba TaxID=326968 RepID=A0ABM4A3X8_ZIZJJ|nr:LRR receptor-like serine/threonine-protein kinase FLS2 [Ziziphus jujuba]
MDMCHRLPNLEAFYLPDSPIRGHILASLCLCRNLKQLGLGKIGFAGTIPKFLSNLSLLEILDLQENNQSGEISSELGKLSNLRMLNLQYNKLSGRLPPTFCSLNSSIERIYVSKNLLRGHISDLCLCKKLREVITGFQLPMLREVYLSLNRLSGRIPDSISNASMLIILELATNFFSGPVLMTFGGLQYLKILNLQENELTNGPSPKRASLPHFFDTVSPAASSGHWIGKLVNLVILDLSKNQLSATTPETVSNLKMLEQLDLSNNAFQGNIPASIGDLGSLKSLGLSSNNLSGIIPKSMEKLRYLNF